MIHRLRALEEKGIVLFGKMVPPALPYMRKYQRLLRYLISGGTAAAVDLILLYILTDSVGLHYLTSAVLAFLVALVVSFLLQKFWTFQDESVDRVHKQATAYFIIAALNLGLNTFLIYLFVEYAHLWYIFAQVLASGLIAFESFFISRYFIFKKSREEKHTNESPLQGGE